MNQQPTDFIEVIDDVLPVPLCQQIITQFEHSENVTPGRTGGGVDLDKKRSHDVSFSENQEFKFS